MTKNPLPFIETLSKGNRCAVLAYEKGYRIIDGVPHTPQGKPRKVNIRNQNGYKAVRFSIKLGSLHFNLPVHKLAAFQKFGYEMFTNNYQVRHLDSDSTNNRLENIALGSVTDNRMDMPEEQRVELAINATKKNRVLTDAQIGLARCLHDKAGWGYKKLMTEFGVKSKGTMHHILNNDYVTTF
jgi:hypothetical protein